ncbi:MAG: bacillithiol system redox-active protein YtxJ [Bacteroidetes bacterium]|nr:bacillithiol system redox-active protein YtxJ [Bacteroidota bacterium]
MDWHELRSEAQVDEITEGSASIPVLIFKHSTRCSISAMALSRFERQWNNGGGEIKPFFLDLLKFRNVSDYISSKFKVQHESPQVLVITGGTCVYHAAHNAIDVDDVFEQINN